MQAQANPLGQNIIVTPSATTMPIPSDVTQIVQGAMPSGVQPVLVYTSPQMPSQSQIDIVGQGANEPTESEEANALKIMNIIKNNVDSSNIAESIPKKENNENPAYSIIKNDIEKANSNLRKKGDSILFDMENEKLLTDKNKDEEKNNITKKVDIKIT